MAIELYDYGARRFLEVFFGEDTRTDLVIILVTGRGSAIPITPAAPILPEEPLWGALSTENLRHTIDPTEMVNIGLVPGNSSGKYRAEIKFGTSTGGYKIVFNFTVVLDVSGTGSTDEIVGYAVVDNAAGKYLSTHADFLDEELIPADSILFADTLPSKFKPVDGESSLVLGISFQLSHGEVLD